MSNELLIELIDLFPSVGMVVPEVELKFRLAAKHGQDTLDDVLDKLVNKQILSRFDFNNMIHYKSKEDIPITLGGKPAAGGAATAAANGVQLIELSKIVMELAKSANNAEVSDLAKAYQEKYMSE
ncbi:MAG: hypothetical protein ACXADH_11480 [Candidatus Kariarchaeaceae archaeon]|jgi:hypothetical protein